jgi:hypothetical protein
VPSVQPRGAIALAAAATVTGGRREKYKYNTKYNTNTYNTKYTPPSSVFPFPAATQHATLAQAQAQRNRAMGKWPRRASGIGQGMWIHGYTGMGNGESINIEMCWVYFQWYLPSTCPLSCFPLSSQRASLSKAHCQQATGEPTFMHNSHLACPPSSCPLENCPPSSPPSCAEHVRLGIMSCTSLAPR